MSPVAEASVGQRDDWDHGLTILAPAAGAANHTVTPTSGFVQITYAEDDGSKRWWNGTTFVTAETTLSTTISGNRSRYPYVHQAQTYGRKVVFEGWVRRNGYDSPHIVREVEVKSQVRAETEFFPATEPEP